MKRYINVADLYGILNEMDMLETYNDFIAVQRAINNTPTADVVEVVRCKDCVYRYTEACGTKHERVDMDFCSHGLRKDDE